MYTDAFFAYSNVCRNLHYYKVMGMINVIYIEVGIF